MKDKILSTVIVQYYTLTLILMPYQKYDIAIKDIQNLFTLKKEIKGIKDLVRRNVKNLCEYDKEEENYYKPVGVNSL